MDDKAIEFKEKLEKAQLIGRRILEVQKELTAELDREMNNLFRPEDFEYNSLLKFSTKTYASLTNALLNAISKLNVYIKEFETLLDQLENDYPYWSDVYFKFSNENYPRKLLEVAKECIELYKADIKRVNEVYDIVLKSENY